MEEDDNKVPPVGVKYVRLQLHHRMSPPMQREAATLGRILDCLLCGRAAEACDITVQRLKSLEAVAGGIHYSVANRMELLAPEKSMATSSAETLEAARRVSQEEKLLHKASKPGGKPWESSYPSKGGGKQGKGKGEKGKAKDQRQKGDGKQAERKEG